jgi:hypothetical protein
VTRDKLNYHLKKLHGRAHKKEAAVQIMQLAAERMKLIGVEVPEAVAVETSELSGSSKSGRHPKCSTKQYQTSTSW